MAKLKEVCTFFADGDWIESSDQSDEGIRLIQTGNIGEGKYLEKETRAKYISESTFNKLSCTEVYPGDILVSRLPEPVGRACIIPEYVLFYAFKCLSHKTAWQCHRDDKKKNFKKESG